jgi:hypothetical protein
MTSVVRAGSFGWFHGVQGEHGYGCTVIESSMQASERADVRVLALRASKHGPAGEAAPVHPHLFRLLECGKLSAARATSPWLSINQDGAGCRWPL